MISLLIGIPVAITFILFFWALYTERLKRPSHCKYGTMVTLLEHEGSYKVYSFAITNHVTGKKVEEVHSRNIHVWTQERAWARMVAKKIYTRLEDAPKYTRFHI